MRSLLNQVPTEVLVEELRTREGVSAMDVEPHYTKYVEVDGPAIVLVVID